MSIKKARANSLPLHPGQCYCCHGVAFLSEFLSAAGNRKLLLAKGRSELIDCLQMSTRLSRGPSSHLPGRSYYEKSGKSGRANE